MRATRVEKTAQRTTGPKVLAEKLRAITSRAKNVPAMGALKAAAMPPAAPAEASARS